MRACAHVDEREQHGHGERKSGEELSYDPRRLQGVTVYREAERSSPRATACR
jgi:hypothetical protein